LIPEVHSSRRCGKKHYGSGSPRERHDDCGSAWPIADYNFARLKTLCGLTPYEFLCRMWKKNHQDSDKTRTIKSQTKHLVAYPGLVPSERSTGEQVRRGSITKYLL
jgi:hypothetical protein